MSEADETISSGSRSKLKWASALQDASSLLLLVLSPLSHAETSLMLKLCPPGLCTKLRSSSLLELRSLESHGWWLGL